MPEREDLAVDRVEAIECLLNSQQPLGPLGGLRRRGLLSQKHRGQCGGAGLGKRLVEQRDLAAGVAHLGAEVVAVQRSSAARRRSVAAKGTAVAWDRGGNRQDASRRRGTRPERHRRGQVATGAGVEARSTIRSADRDIRRRAQSKATRSPARRRSTRRTISLGLGFMGILHNLRPVCTWAVPGQVRAPKSPRSRRVGISPGIPGLPRSDAARDAWGVTGPEWGESNVAGKLDGVFGI